MNDADKAIHLEFRGGRGLRKKLRFCSDFDCREGKKEGV